MNDVIRLENVVKMYAGARRAVNGVTLSIGDKQRVILCGPSGSGKRTLMKLIAGMEAPSSGNVEVLGKAVHDMDERTASRFRNKYIGVVPESPGFLDGLTVLENVALPLAARGVAQPQRRRAAQQQLETTGIEHIAYAYPSQLSRLEAQMASVARALIAKPCILLLYNILSALSEKETEQFAGTMHAIWKHGDYTALYFTGSAPAMDADALITLEHGKVQEDIS